MGTYPEGPPTTTERAQRELNWSNSRPSKHARHKHQNVSFKFGWFCWFDNSSHVGAILLAVLVLRDPTSSVPRVETVTQDDDDLDDPEIFEHCPIGLGEQVTRHMESLANEDPDLDLLLHISGHYTGTDEESTLAAALMQSDHPLVTAKYILKHRVGPDNTKFLNGRYTRWARVFLRNVNVIVRRMVRSDGNDMLQIDDVTTPLVPENLSLSFDVEGGNRTVRLIRRTAQHTEKMKKRKSKRRSKPGSVTTMAPSNRPYGNLKPRCYRTSRCEISHSSRQMLWHGNGK